MRFPVVLCVFRSHFKWVTLSSDQRRLAGARCAHKFLQWLHIIAVAISTLYRMINVRGHIHLQYKHIDNTFYLTRGDGDDNDRRRRHHVRHSMCSAFFQPFCNRTWWFFFSFASAPFVDSFCLFSVSFEASLISICVQCNLLCVWFFSSCVGRYVFTFGITMQTSILLECRTDSEMTWHDSLNSCSREQRTKCDERERNERMETQYMRMYSEWEMMKNTKSHKEIAQNNQGKKAKNYCERWRKKNRFGFFQLDQH